MYVFVKVGTKKTVAIRRCMWFKQRLEPSSILSLLALLCGSLNGPVATARAHTQPKETKNNYMCLITGRRSSSSVVFSLYYSRTPGVIYLQLCTPKVVGVEFKLYTVYNPHHYSMFIRK
jgi:hypothetical protein